jgi:hypothetical protein
MMASVSGRMSNTLLGVVEKDAYIYSRFHMFKPEYTSMPQH